MGSFKIYGEFMSIISCDECNREISSKAISCPHCGNPITLTNDSSILANSSLEESRENKAPEQNKVKLTKYEKIGGWLILVGFGVITSPIRLAKAISENLPAYETATWDALTTPGTEAYHPMWERLLVFEMLGNISFFIFSLVIAIYFFKKKSQLPRLLIVFMVANLLFMIADYSLGASIPYLKNDASFVSEARQETIKMAMGCLIWIPYFLISKRVKGTFVR
jgi:hypothetical protein